MRTVLCLIASVLAWSGPLLAQPSPSAREIIERLAPTRLPPVPPPTQTATTSPAQKAADAGPADRPADADAGKEADAVVPDASGASAAGRSRLRNLSPVARRIDLNIPFELDSATLKAESRSQLQELGAALQSERLTNMRFRIEGHTDFSGTQDHNDRLSSARATAVADYLIRLGVSAQRLETVGHGFRFLLTGEDPRSAVHRRVRIVALD